MTLVVVDLEDARGVAGTHLTTTEPWSTVLAQLRTALHCDDELPPATWAVIRAGGAIVARVPDDRHWTTVARDLRALFGAR